MRVCLFLGSGSVVDNSLLIVTTVACGFFVFGICFVMLYLVSFLFLQLSR